MEKKLPEDILNKWNDEINTPLKTSNEIKGNESVLSDIKNFSSNRVKEMKDSLLENVFTNEMNAFYIQYRRLMNHNERKYTIRELQKKINKGLIYVNEIGQIKYRKSNTTSPKSKKKKRK